MSFQKSLCVLLGRARAEFKTEAVSDLEHLQKVTTEGAEDVQSIYIPASWLLKYVHPIISYCSLVGLVTVRCNLPLSSLSFPRLIN